MSKRFLYFKCLCARLFGRWMAFSLFSLRNKGYLFEMGWFQSRRYGAAIDGAGSPIPWITYPCLSFLCGRLRKDFVVFEYGAGNSTLWWANRAKKVFSCEHDAKWYGYMKEILPANAELNFVELEYGGRYSQQITQHNILFDVVFVDGRDRENCVKNAIPCLKSEGVLVFDNSDVSDYASVLDFLEGSGFKRLDFWGPGPINLNTWCTSVFYRANNCLGI